jgi:hypothetical protein
MPVRAIYRIAFFFDPSYLAQRDLFANPCNHSPLPAEEGPQYDSFSDTGKLRKWYSRPMLLSNRKSSLATRGPGYLTIGASDAKHVLYRADSRRSDFKCEFDLVLTSPPFFHPIRSVSVHGRGYRGNVERYAEEIAGVLFRCSQITRNKRVCFLKTDIWHQGKQIPVGYEISKACMALGMSLRAHWVWERREEYSPYAPGFANIFVFGSGMVRPHFSGVIDQGHQRTIRGVPSSFTPDIFRVLLEYLSQVGECVLDPFAGVGGVIEAAASIGRRTIGLEVSASQLKLALKRLKPISGFAFRDGLEP